MACIASKRDATVARSIEVSVKLARPMQNHFVAEMIARINPLDVCALDAKM